MNKKALKTLSAAALLAGVLTGSAFATSIGGADVDASALNLRTDPSTSSTILAAVPRGTTVVVGEKTNDEWYKVVYLGAVGFMSSDYLTFSETLDGDFGTGTIYGTGVRMRSAPSLSSAVLGTYDSGTEMTVLGVSGGWYKVSCNGSVGYVYSDCFSLNGGVSELYDSDLNESSPGQTIVDTAQQYLGVSYVWAGTSPSGFDCSGLVYYVYKECGYTINRTAASIYSYDGTYVDRDDLAVGDVICFSNSYGGGIGHVGIYIGNGQFIHASSGDGCVRIDSLDTAYYNNHYVGAKRII